MVNKTNCLIMAEAFARQELARREENPIGYNQTTWRGSRSVLMADYTGHACGTIACVAGWTVAKLAPGLFDTLSTAASPDAIMDRNQMSGRAAELLGLTREQANALFGGGANPERYDTDYSTCTASAVLKHLGETGEVNWKKAQSVARKKKAGD